MHELRNFQNKIISAKRELKEAYYTTRDEGIKSDAKELVVATIGLERTIEELIALRRKRKVARKVLEDRKAKLSLRKWTTGLPRRVKDYKQKKKKLKQEHLTKFQETLLGYMETIGLELSSWIIDIETITDLPKLPK